MLIFQKFRVLLLLFIVAFIGAFWFRNYQKASIFSLAYSLPSNIPISVCHWDELTSEQIAFAKSEGVDVIYLSIDQYLDIYEQKDGEEKNRALQNFEQKLSQIISIANQKEIQIHALAGSTKWANADYWYLPLALERFVLQFNKAHPARGFAGLQYDIEFYNDQEYKNNAQQLSQDYLRLVAQLSAVAATAGGDEFSLGFTMPYWFDNENGNAPIVSWAGQKKEIAFHILDMLSSLPNSYVVLMSYRNYATGANGTLEISQAEIDYAKNVRIVIGQETEDNEIEKITFYKKGKKQLITAVREIQQAFANKSSFAGVAIHTLKGLREIK